MNTAALIRSDARAAGIDSALRLAMSIVGASPFWALVLYRLGHSAHRHAIPVVGHFLRGVGLIVWGADIWPTARLGPSCRIAHPQGVVIGSAVVAGSDLHLFAGAVLGGSKRHRPEWNSNQPRLGDRVTVSSHAVVAGGVSVGDDVLIGANAVVLIDVPADHVVRSSSSAIAPRYDQSAERRAEL